MATKNSLILVLIVTTAVVISDALQCYQCGQYNDGVGSITPCTNYSTHLAHLHLKNCPRAKDKYCIKYVSELSTVRDCVADCTEKEVWETRTYCCTEDGCNGTNFTVLPSIITLLLPIAFILIAILRKH